MKVVRAALMGSIPVLLTLSVIAQAAPVPSKPKPASKPVAAASAAKQATKVAANAATAHMATELKRLMVGNQAGIVKVLGPKRQGVAYARGIDDRSLARLDDGARSAIFSALNLEEAKLPSIADVLISGHAKLPKKEAVALLGAMASKPDLHAPTREKIETHLLKVMESDKDVAARRQAILALALLPQVGPATTERVVKLFERSENLWETFPVQQYFEYHAERVRQHENYTQLRDRIGNVKSLYTPNVLSYLDRV